MPTNIFLVSGTPCDTWFGPTWESLGQIALHLSHWSCITNFWPFKVYKSKQKHVEEIRYELRLKISEA